MYFTNQGQLLDIFQARFLLASRLGFCLELLVVFALRANMSAAQEKLGRSCAEVPDSRRNALDASRTSG